MAMTPLRKVAYSIGLDWSWLNQERISLSQKLRYIPEKYFALVSGRARIHYLSVKSFAYDNRNTPVTLQSYPEEIGRLASWLGPEPLVLDVGANVGQFAVTFATLIPGAKVFSIEPNPEAFQLLKHNTAEFPGIQLHNVAVGPSGRMPLYYVPGASAVGGLWRENAIRSAAGTRTVKVDVDVLTLDAKALRERGLPRSFDLVKIDVEGFEGEALAAMPDVRAQFVFVEFSLNRPHSYTFPELLRSIERITGPAELVYCSTIDYADRRETMGNALLCSRECSTRARTGPTDGASPEVAERERRSQAGSAVSLHG